MGRRLSSSRASLGAGGAAGLGSSRASGSRASLGASGGGVSAGRGSGGISVGVLGVVATSAAGSLRSALGGDEVVLADAALDAVAIGLVVSSGALALRAGGDTLGGGVDLAAVGRGNLWDIRVSH